MMPDKMKLIVIPQTGKQFRAVKALLFRKDIDRVVIATDAGREGELVARCIREGLTLETLPLEAYREVCELFDEGVYEAISLEKCVSDRTPLGGPAPENVRAQAERVRALMQKGE